VNPLIRSEHAEDIASIRTVHQSAFPGPGEAEVVDALRASGHLTISLVAEVAGAGIVGHIAFSPVTLETGLQGLGLAPLAVLPEFQRQGIGGKLVRAGITACHDAIWPYIVVLGDPEYYQRFGFVTAARWKLLDEYGGGSAFQAIELRPLTLPAGGGLVRYGEEFALIG
jgi:putative acetyltransferase